ncbi:MAG TPA: hypothetical protein PLN52_20605 [Opitutaceae bacterium]|nr:hypothetical protein [Opitutaceae bacterium]
MSAVSVGLNGSDVGDYVLNYINGRAIQGGRLFSLHGAASYRGKLLNLPTVVRLNVRNLLETKYVTTGVVKLLDGSIRNLHAYGDPLNVSLTTTVEF